MSKNDLHDLLTKDCTIKKKVACAKEKLKITDVDCWKASLWNDRGQENGNKLRTYRLYKSELLPYVKINMDMTHRRILAKFRSGSLPLNIETGRYAKPKVPLLDRTCKLCSNNCIEDEMHF